MNGFAWLLLSMVTLAADPPATAPAVTVRPLDGQAVAGKLTALVTDRIELDTAGGQQSLASREVLWVDIRPAETSEKPSAWLDLVDGSKLRAESFTTKDGTARIGLTSGVSVELPARAIRAVRFNEQSPEVAAQWRDVLAAKATGDVVVIRKQATLPPTEGQEDAAPLVVESLDQLEGVIGDIGPETLEFEAGGEKVSARRDKLEGLIFIQRGEPMFPSPACRLIDAGGTSWSLRELKQSGDTLQATTVGGQSLELPFNSIARLDFSAGNVQHLADLEPDTGGGALSVSLQPANMTYKFGRVFQVRSAPPLGADGFRIAGTRYDSGLALHSPLTLVYRVPEGFRWFRAVAGIDDSIVAPGKFALVILGDGKELLRQSFGGDAMRAAVPIELDLSGIRRVSIVLEQADGLDIGDQLNLCDARFTK